ncbi:hypothetical protein Tco_1255087 [Tanacetum coccineum]
MECGFLSQKGSRGGRGVKEKDLNWNNKNTSSGIGVSMDSNDTMNDDTPIGVASAIQEGVTPYVADMMAGNASGKSSYANVTGKPSGKKLNIHTLFTPGGKRVAYPIIANYVRNTWGKYRLVRTMFSSSTRLFSFQFSSMDGLDDMLENGLWFIRNNPFILKKWHPNENLLKEDVNTVLVWVKLHGVPVTAFSDDGLSAIATKLGTPLMLDSYTSDMCMKSWGRSSYARVMIELRADVELKDNIVMAMPRIKEEGYYTCNIYVEYEWKPPRCACCKVFRHVHEECTKNIGAGATKNLKKTSQTPKGISVGQKMGFKSKQVFQPVSKNSTANTGGKKRNKSESTKEVSKSTPFEVLTSVDNDVDLGTNGGISNSADKGTNNFSSCNTPIGEKVDKIERQIYEGKLKFVDDDGNPLLPTDRSDNDYGTNSLLEQWRDSYLDNDDYDPYDDDMYENHDIFLRSKDEASEAIIKCIKNIQVRLNVTVRNVRTDNGTKFVNQTLREFENVSVSHETFAEAINIACYTQNRSLIRLRYNKTPYELMHDKKPNLSFLHVFGSLCYPTNDSKDLGKIDTKADIGLVSNPIPQQPCNPPKRDDWDSLFQPMSYEYFNPPTMSISPVPVATAPRAVDLANSPVSTSIDQDAPSTSIPSTQEQ